jgi:hypothetical protein
MRKSREAAITRPVRINEANMPAMMVMRTIWKPRPVIGSLRSPLTNMMATLATIPETSEMVLVAMSLSSVRR